MIWIVLATVLMCSHSKASSITFKLVNNCSRPIWPAIGQNAPSLNPTWLTPDLDPLPPGHRLGPSESFHTKPIPQPWGGRIWGRQNCSLNGTNCLLGDCSASSCWSKSSSRTTLFEVSATGNGVYYDISLGTCLLVNLMAVN